MRSGADKGARTRLQDFKQQIDNDNSFQFLYAFTSQVYEITARPAAKTEITKEGTSFLLSSSTLHVCKISFKKL